MENFDINSLNRTLQESFIHYEPNRIDFTINNEELILLEDAGNNFWKEMFFGCLGLCIPTILNAKFCKVKIENGWSDEMFYNSLIGGITLVLCILSALLWYKTAKKVTNIITHIKNKPKYRIPSN